MKDKKTIASNVSGLITIECQKVRVRKTYQVREA